MQRSPHSPREMLEIDAARALLLERTQGYSLERELIAVDAARNRVTASRIDAPMNVPPFTASAMDGYAVASDDPIFMAEPPYRIRVSGVSRAGHPMPGALAAGTAARVFTGSVMPHGSNAVVLQENVVIRSDDLVEFDERPSAGRWVRRAGHDVDVGTALLPRGRKLNAFDLASLTASGLTEVLVNRCLRIALFSTGDELRTPPDVLAPGQIYDANRLVLKQLLAPLPVTITDLGILPDDEQTISDTLATAAAGHDVVLTSGGVSVGDADFVRRAWQRVGALDFWKIALKPGKPLAYGHAGRCHFFGLPGNPVSTIVTFLLIVRPLLASLAGCTTHEDLRVSAVAAHGIEHEPGRAEYQRGIFRSSTDGLVVAATGDQSSNRIGSFSGANCLIELPKENPGVLAGARVQILPLEGLLS